MNLPRLGIARYSTWRGWGRTGCPSRLWGCGEDVADLSVDAVCRIESVPAVDQAFELCFQVGELTLSCPDVAQLGEQLRVDVGAGDTSAIA